MTGYEPQIFRLGSDHSTNWATTTESLVADNWSVKLGWWTTIIEVPISSELFESSFKTFWKQKYV